MFPSLQEMQWYVAAVALATAAWKLLPWLWRSRLGWTPVATFFRSAQRLFDEVAQMKVEISAIRRRVDAELGPNGGGSLKDQVTLIAARQTAIFDGMARPAFEANASGNFISVNRAFELLTGYRTPELLDMGWVNVVHQDDVERFMIAWQHAIRDRRILRWSCRLVTADDKTIEVCIDAMPMRASSPSSGVLGWYGTLETS